MTIKLIFSDEIIVAITLRARKLILVADYSLRGLLRGPGEEYFFFPKTFHEENILAEQLFCRSVH